MTTEGIVTPGPCPTHTTNEERAVLTGARDRWWAATLQQAEEFSRGRTGLVPMHKGPNPACWDWPTPEPFDLWEPTFEVGPGDDQYTQEAAADLLRLCRDIERRGWFYLSDWQNGRCAVCARGGELVDDHDHATGLIRGLLCRSCNTREGLNRGSTGIFAAYRSTNPASILGIRVRYWDPFSGEYADPGSRS